MSMEGTFLLDKLRVGVVLCLCLKVLEGSGG